MTVPTFNGKPQPDFRPDPESPGFFFDSEGNTWAADSVEDERARQRRVREAREHQDRKSGAAPGIRAAPNGEDADEITRRAPEPNGLPMLTLDDLAALPPAEYVIEGVLPLGMSVLFGASGTGKSFLAADWGCSIAANRPWFGRPVKGGTVVYLAGEGARGMLKRVRAWEDERGVTVPSARFLTVPFAANLLDGDQLAAANRAISSARDVRLIVVDTLARHMPGGDENSARDMGLFVRACDHLAAIHNSAVLPVHHTGKDGARHERGSSSLEGAADARWRLDGTELKLTLTCHKMKDDERPAPWHLRLEGRLDSLVVRLGTASGPLTETERALLVAVSRHFGTDPASARSIEESAGTPKSSTYRVLESLTERALLTKDDGATPATWTLTPAGHALAVPTSPNQSHETRQSSPSQPPSLGGGTGTAPQPQNALTGDLA